MKADADLFFLQGINQIIGHGWPYSPPEISEPGWRFYAAGAFNDHNPWWPVMPEVTRYLQRISYLLRQGKPVNDVALFVPTDDAWAQFSPGNDSVSESTEQLLGPNVIPEILNSGLDFDFIDNRAIDQNGIPYPVLILPGVERLPLAIYHRIEHYVQEGGVVIATRNLPSRAPGLRQARTDTAEIRQISRELFQNPGAKGYFVADERQLGELLNHHFTPDLSTAPKIPELGFAHRKLPFADIYFLANTSNRSVSTTAKFRTQATYAEWWDPFSGEVSPAASSSTIDLKLEPYESRLLVVMNQAHSFAARSTTARGREKVASTIDLGKDWTVTFPELNRTIHMNELRSWTDDEVTRFYSGRAVYEKNFAVPARAGKRIYLDFGPGTIVQQYSHSHFRVWLDGPVRESAQVIINDRPAGSIWKPPYKLDVTELLRNGENHLRIVVYNLAINSLAGRALPDYRLLNSRYGERFVPQGMEHLEALPSGLLGAPRLVIAEAP